MWSAVIRWWKQPAHWWQFWMPQSGFRGGVCLGIAVLLLWHYIDFAKGITP